MPTAILFQAMNCIPHRYHATAVDTDNYLALRMVYVDLNMVRAGAVSHTVTGCIGLVCACFAAVKSVRTRP